jgi:hypothetical protein
LKQTISEDLNYINIPLNTDMRVWVKHIIRMN